MRCWWPALVGGRAIGLRAYRGYVHKMRHSAPTADAMDALAITVVENGLALAGQAYCLRRFKSVRKAPKKGK